MKRYLITLFVIMVIGNLAISQTRIDSLKSKLEQAEINEKFSILQNIVLEFKKSDTQLMKEYAEEGLELARNQNDLHQKATFSYLYGRALEYGGQHERAIDYFYEALRLQEKLGDLEGQLHTMKDIAFVFSGLGKHDLALEYSLKAKDFAEKLGDQSLIAMMSQNIAILYSQKGEGYQTALEYFKRALGIYREMGNEENIIAILTNIGHSYYLLADDSTALIYLDEALQRAKKIEHIPFIAKITQNIGLCYSELGKFEKAEELLLEVVRISSNKYPKIRLNATRWLAELYRKYGDYRKGYEYLERGIYLSDSLYTLESEERVAEIQTKYETEKKEQQIILLEKDNTIAGLQLKRQRALLLYSVIGIIIILVFLFILSKLCRQKVKTSKALAVANGQLEELSRTDPLTKLWNRRYMHEIIEREESRVEREFKPFSFILMDIDHFKNVNDTYGHECGDYVISTIAVILRSAVRKQDSVCRWGGEEFLLFLPATSLKGAAKIAETIRRKIEDYPFVYQSTTLSITVTLGVSEYNQSVSVDACIKLADDALYTGKESGRNRVVSMKKDLNKA